MRKLVSGFTLIELIVVLAIITVILGIAFTSQSSFNRSLILANTAYDIGLTFRSSETYGIATRAAGTDVNTGYGLHFMKQSPNNSFIFFEDSYPPLPQSSACHPNTLGSDTPAAKPGDCVYTLGRDIQTSTYSLNNGITIADFCVRNGSSWSCANSHGAGLSSLDVVFARPNPTPFMSANGSYVSGYNEACLSLTSSSGGARYVSVSASGEIDPHAVSCPTP